MRAFSSLRSVLVAAATAALVAVGAAAPASAQQLQLPAPIAPSFRLPSLLKSQGCKSEYLIAVPGGVNTMPGLPRNLPHGGNVWLTGVLTQLYTGGQIQPLWIAYDAAPFATTQYQTASNRGYAETKKAVAGIANACPNARFSFTGYSLGADIVSRMLNNIAHDRGPIAKERVASAALFSSPYQGGNGAVMSAGTSPHVRGSLGELEGGYGDLGERVLEICNTGDIVCSPSEDQREIVDPAMDVNLSSGEMPRWVIDIARANDGRTSSIIHSIGAHGSYTLAQQHEAANWIANHR